MGLVIIRSSNHLKRRIIIKKEVGVCAGKIWHLLNTKGQVRIEDVIDSCEKNTTVAMLALGWLCRENKIIVLTEGTQQIVELVQHPEFYY